MCGIAGIIGHHSKEEAMQQMLQVQQHRGPDHTGIRCVEHICLGHNRLSIIDLSEAANQPMADDTGRYLMVFNGEIYNYKELREKYFAGQRFTSNGDSEVLLKLFITFGDEILHELIGMFSFAIWDNEHRELFAARDRFGVKPFYYSYKQDQFVFASEINTLWQAGVDKQPRVDIWSAYFNNGSYGMPADTFWESIFQLPAGHSLRLSAGKAPAIKQWYHFQKAIEEQKVFKTDEALHNAYLELLQHAVSLRFRADVPVGFSLSGGLDSSLLLAAIHHLFPANSAIAAFTFCSDHKAYDELPWAQTLAAKTTKPLHAVTLTALQVPGLAKQMSHMQAEPYGGIPTLAYHQLFLQANHMGYKVLLDGQGMDEAWAGYDYYYANHQHLVQGSVSSPIEQMALDTSFANSAQAFTYKTPFKSHLQNLQYRDLFVTKLPRALRFNDRASMLASVELREPFLDHRLVEMAFAQNDNMKKRNGQPKWMLRTIAKEWLGSDLAFAPKRPVQTPQREWLRNELKDWATDQINWLAGEGNPGWFDGKKMKDAWLAFANGKGDNSFFVWQWINTAMLLKKD